MAIRLCSNCRLNGTDACPYAKYDPNLYPSNGCQEHEFILLFSQSKKEGVR